MPLFSQWFALFPSHADIGYRQNGEKMPIKTAIIILGIRYAAVLWSDVTVWSQIIKICRRIMNTKSVTAPHQGHVHQVLLSWMYNKNDCYPLAPPCEQ